MTTTEEEKFPNIQTSTEIFEPTTEQIEQQREVSVNYEDGSGVVEKVVSPAASLHSSSSKQNADVKEELDAAKLPTISSKHTHTRHTKHAKRSVRLPVLNNYIDAEGRPTTSGSAAKSTAPRRTVSTSNNESGQSESGASPQNSPPKSPSSGRRKTLPLRVSIPEKPKVDRQYTPSLHGKDRVEWLNDVQRANLELLERLRSQKSQYSYKKDSTSPTSLSLGPSVQTPTSLPPSDLKPQSTTDSSFRGDKSPSSSPPPKRVGGSSSTSSYESMWKRVMEEQSELARQRAESIRQFAELSRQRAQNWREEKVQTPNSNGTEREEGTFRTDRFADEERAEFVAKERRVRQEKIARIVRQLYAERGRKLAAEYRSDAPTNDTSVAAY
mmetsp:Transcript_4675/g.7239  ORF Transcript_4675/g.7239 Transcript_4675/m.7239 type:complete len:384 (-) Transcript_4675:362-1513(-)|eukprot:CAMPEP_0184664176 /NCGR_PEP_ID=MMETSP0308-20130426/51603_1 /TAXON_ID=38269 /ORGANISM="Gloeochaete witrockiana, Strain SAG 46.84" /LENGTH=383 /DNA_ID=CAMNT_0027107391 /DNA_START=109 /DNA_END=1260 /DNA_ORIENTATION=+